MGLRRRDAYPHDQHMSCKHIHSFMEMSREMRTSAGAEERTSPVTRVRERQAQKDRNQPYIPLCMCGTYK